MPKVFAFVGVVFAIAGTVRFVSAEPGKEFDLMTCTAYGLAAVLGLGHVITAERKDRAKTSDR